MSQTQDIPLIGTAMVDALIGAFGRHPHKRASHAKGIFATGRFIASATAAQFGQSRLFAGQHSATVRFSIAGGNPAVSDKANAARGMSIDVNLGNGEHLVLVMISAPMFFAATPQAFISFLAARRIDPATGKPDPDAVALSNKTHTDSEAQRRWLAATPPSVSFATAPYFAVHTYFFDNPDGTKHSARWIFEPLAGRVGLDADELKSFPDNFLNDELARRLSRGPVEWRVLLQLPHPIDPLHNPTTAWPESRKTIEVGRFVVEDILPSVDGDALDETVFDPERLPAGITAAGDPIFDSRSAAYSMSLAHRLVCPLSENGGVDSAG
ncbi:catalase family peroxidase [Rhizobium sp. CECT 9324]|uniref:catalase family peroxidase n=1 Tax=Rhizobium sp. CECT 9324 TaxID=2845820 RepID=UPI001E57FE0F|nr:catalase family peroxidase [Rhizobium sp. CECT 9324]CAH0340885.1 Catalase-related peroxidase [Rhizobium sp. CECT 9324]